MSPSTERHSRRGSTGPPPWWVRRVDLLVLPGVFLFDILVFSRLLRADITAAERVAIVCYSAIGVALLVFRRLAPLVVFAAVWVHAMLALLFTTSYIPMVLLLVALEAVAEFRSARVSLSALAALLVPTGLLVAAAASQASPGAATTAAVGSALFYTAADLLAWGIGRWARRHQGRLSSLQLEHQREVEQQRADAAHAVSAERLRIARELHDIVAHSVTIMVLHAAGAKRVVDTDPARAKDSLATIEESGQQAMAELRRLLELLRESDSPPARSGSPLPGLAELDQLISTVRGSGVAVTMETTGRPRRLDASTDLAVYRLVQEGLTNVVKHRGAGAAATVSIEWGQEKVTIAVEDDGSGSPSGTPALSTGNGLAGLSERIAIAGGDFAAGRTETGGFRVAARLPVSTMTTGTTPAESADGDSDTSANPAADVTERTAPGLFPQRSPLAGQPAAPHLSGSEQ